MTSLIAGRYELGDQLGIGGMSTVQLALDRRLERHVAVKLLAEHLAHDSQFVSRFRREAMSAARLVHPNIVQVFDFGFDEASGRHFIVMEYVRGRSGAEILRTAKKLGVEETLALVDGACRGLAHAHRLGVIHRDVKPGNILRSDDGAVKLADFGIAKATMDTSSQLTQAGSVLGTAAYLAPEQAAGEEAGPAADLYGLGVVTYQFLAGRLPYEATSLTELAMVQRRELPPRLDELAPEVPGALAQAVAMSLALEPERRYASAEAMRKALRDGARGIAPTGFEETAPTSMLGAGEDDTARTRALRAQKPSRRLEPSPPRRPVAPEYERERVVAAPAPAAGGRRRGGAGRAAIWALIIAVVLAAGAFAVVNNSGSGNSVRLDPIDGGSVGQVVDQARQLIEDNTR